jgi:hypothetical protein
MSAADAVCRPRHPVAAAPWADQDSRWDRGEVAMNAIRSLALLAPALLLLSMAGPAPVGAAGNDIRWTDCSSAGARNMNSDCFTTPPRKLYVGIVPPAGADHVIGFDAWIAVSVGSGGIPPYWEVWPGGCRDGKVRGNFDFTAGPFTCADPWMGQLNGTLEIMPPPYLAGYTFGLHLSGTLPDSQEVAMDPSTEYYLGSVSVVGSDPALCAGCLLPGCFVLENVCLRQRPGAPLICQGYREVGTPSCLWQDPQQVYSGCALPVPAMRTSWGAIKIRYR